MLEEGEKGSAATSLGYGLLIMGAGAVMLILFMWILVRQYQFMK